MVNYRNILVGLDLTGMDPFLIRYAAFFANVMNSRKIIFLHVIQAYDIPEEKRDKIRDIYNSLKEHLNKEIKQHLGSVPDKMEIKVDVKIEDRDVSEVIIKNVRRHKIDLTVLGKKADSQRAELYSARTIALSESDMLLVPADPPDTIERVMAAVDLNKESNKGVKMAHWIGRYTNAKLFGQFIFSQNKSFFPFSFENQQDYVQKLAEKKIKQFKKNHWVLAHDLDWILHGADNYHEQTKKIIQSAEEKNADIIILAAKGRTSSNSTLLGMVAEGLRKQKSNKPVLIMKNRFEKNSFFNIFLQG
ncbi:MAG: universal stress protein [Bacteroidota bacterium]